MKIDLEAVGTNLGNGITTNVATRCPHCGHFGTFEPASSNSNDVFAFKPSGVGFEPGFFLGIRKCPNRSCNGHLFFITDSGQKLLFTSPNVAIPFDKDNIPDKVLRAFDEAVRCHSASCFIASAIMIRKTLEEICIDRDTEGDNLFKRLKSLGSKILIPAELIEAMDELRLLGNDAAHFEAKTYDTIGKDEIELSIEFTKEILKAVYQYQSLLQKMRGFKRAQ